VHRRLQAGVRDERGIALVMALGVLMVISVSLTGIIYFTSTNARSSDYAKAEVSSLALAEAGLNNALAAVTDPDNDVNLEDPEWLGSAAQPITSTFPGGTVTWYGELVEDGPAVYWRITATGDVANPTGPNTADVRQTLTMKVPLRPPPETREALEIWNWIYNEQTGNVCDMTIDQSVALASPLFVKGNLCLRSTAAVVNGPLIVGGNLTLAQPQNSVGFPAQRLTKDVRIGGWCQYKNFSAVNKCQANRTDTNVWVAPGYFGNTPSDYQISLPPVYWAYGYDLPEVGWYEKASPGPFFGCKAATVSGTPPVFDVREPDGRLLFRGSTPAGSFNLAPPSQSYTCITRRGQLSWNHATRELTLRGTIFIDGDAQIQNNTGPIRYVQQPDVSCELHPELGDKCSSGAVLYVGGTFMIKNSTVCGVVAGVTCNQAAWQPNANLFVIAAYSKGGQCQADVSICVVSSMFQGALYGKWAIDASTTSITQGPLVSETEIRVGQTNGVDFPDVTITPVGMPGFGPEFYTALDPEYG
jgi:hypothetical protein